MPSKSSLNLPSYKGTLYQLTQATNGALLAHVLPMTGDQKLAQALQVCHPKCSGTPQQTQQAATPHIFLPLTIKHNGQQQTQKQP